MVAGLGNFLSLVHGGPEMLLRPIPDFSIAQFLMFSLLFGVIAYLVVLFVEGTALWLLQWGSFLRSLRDSAIVNLITSIMGLFPTIFIPPWLDFFYEIGTAPGMLILCGLSVIVEGLLLYVLGKNSFKEVMVTSSIINVCSYVLLYLVNPLIE
jgi:hypothetical protein